MEPMTTLYTVETRANVPMLCHYEAVEKAKTYLIGQRIGHFGYKLSVSKDDVGQTCFLTAEDAIRFYVDRKRGHVDSAQRNLNAAERYYADALDFAAEHGVKPQHEGTPT